MLRFSSVVVIVYVVAFILVLIAVAKIESLIEDNKDDELVYGDFI